MTNNSWKIFSKWSQISPKTASSQRNFISDKVISQTFLQKTRVAALFFCLAFSSYSQAIVHSAEEVLNLPKANREQVFSKFNPKALRSDLRFLAFDNRKSFHLRWEALHALAERFPQETKPDMVRALRSPEWFMRSAGLQALKLHHPKEFHHEAIRALSDPAMMVRSNAVSALGSHLDLATRERLWEEFFHPRNLRRSQSLPIREQILSLLSHQPHEKEVRFWQRVISENANSAFAKVSKSALKKLNIPVAIQAKKTLEDSKSTR